MSAQLYSYESERWSIHERAWDHEAKFKQALANYSYLHRLSQSWRKHFSKIIKERNKS